MHPAPYLQEAFPSGSLFAFWLQRRPVCTLNVQTISQLLRGKMSQSCFKSESQPLHHHGPAPLSDAGLCRTSRTAAACPRASGGTERLGGHTGLFCQDGAVRPPPDSKKLSTQGDPGSRKGLSLLRGGWTGAGLRAAFPRGTRPGRFLSPLGWAPCGPSPTVEEVLAGNLHQPHSTKQRAGFTTPRSRGPFCLFIF